MKVVVGVAYTRTGELAMERGLQAATAEPGAELHLVHALRAEECRSSGTSILDAVSVMRARERLLAHGQRALEALLARSPELDRPRLVAHVRIAEPARAIVQCATEVDALLIVVGTHAPSALHDLGSVAEAVASQSPCTVCVVRCPRLTT